MKNKEISNFIVGYNIFIGISSFFVFVLGIALSEQFNNVVVITFWILGATILIFINLLKNIVVELKKINLKIK